MKLTPQKRGIHNDQSQSSMPSSNQKITRIYTGTPKGKNEKDRYDGYIIGQNSKQNSELQKMKN